MLSQPDAEAIAAVLSNIATCQITLNDFASALSSYQQAREWCERHRMPVLVAQADYNIAWLYYLRGEYGRAIQMLRNTREACRANDDKYHFALCHMDLSEIYLDLNLSQEAEETARQGAALFEALGMSASICRIRRRLRILAHQCREPLSPALPANLTQREVEVLKLVAEGRSNSQIAQVLGLSEKTVTNHLTHIFNKTTCDNRAAATAFAIRHGLA